MDPLSITASAVALGTLVQAIQVSMNSLIRDSKSYSQELKTLAAELQSLSLVLSSLKKYIEANLTLSLDSKHLKSALNACHPTLKSIKSKCEEIRRSASQSSVNKFMIGLFWSSTRTELQELRSSLESHKTTLILSLQLKSLELSLPSTDQKINDDKPEILLGGSPISKEPGTDVPRPKKYHTIKHALGSPEYQAECVKWNIGSSHFSSASNPDIRARNRSEGTRSESIEVTTSTDQPTPWWKIPRDSATSYEVPLSPGNQFPSSENYMDLALSLGVDVKTHSHFGAWKSSFNS